MGDVFHGAKAAVFIGQRILFYKRDSHVHWGDMWDMPGGGREGDETPRACLARELFEEFSLDLSEATELWSAKFPMMTDPNVQAWFFVVQFAETAEKQINFGDEGQYWRLFTVEEGVNLPDLIMPLRERFMIWLEQSSLRLS